MEVEQAGAADKLRPVNAVEKACGIGNPHEPVRRLPVGGMLDHVEDVVDVVEREQLNASEVDPPRAFEQGGVDSGSSDAFERVPMKIEIPVRCVARVVPAVATRHEPSCEEVRRNTTLRDTTRGVEHGRCFRRVGGRNEDVHVAHLARTPRASPGREECRTLQERCRYAGVTERFQRGGDCVAAPLVRRPDPSILASQPRREALGLSASCEVREHAGEQTCLVEGQLVQHDAREPFVPCSAPRWAGDHGGAE